MAVSNNLLEIKTLGTLSLTIGEQPILMQWPDFSLKLLFCTLISPYGENISMEQLCALISSPGSVIMKKDAADQIDRLREIFQVQAGFDPLFFERDRIGIRASVDAYEFFRHAERGFRLISEGKISPGLTNLEKASTLYTGSYLPDVSSGGINNIRDHLENIHFNVVQKINS